MKELFGNIQARIVLWLARRSRRFDAWFVERWKRKLQEQIDYWVENMDIDVKDIELKPMTGTQIALFADRYHARHYRKWKEESTTNPPHNEH